MKLDKTFLNWIIVIGIILIVFTGVYLYRDISSAKKYCENEGGDYTLSIIREEHSCNGSPISKWKDSWEFDSKIDFIIENQQKNPVNQRNYPNFTKLFEGLNISTGGLD